MKIKFVALGIVAAMGLSACDPQMAMNPTPGPKQTNGALLGAVAGAAIGNQFGDGSGQKVATGLGLLLGAAVGSSIGQQMDDLDRLKMANASQKALETAKSNTTVKWSNPDSGNSGSVTPVRTYQSGGSFCREYQQTIIVGGQKQSGYGTACRQPDGSWKIIG